jgi:hypothetical protein
MDDAAALQLREELERLSRHWSIVAMWAGRLRDFDEAWLATDDHTHWSDDGTGSGRRVAVKRQLIDPAHVAFVPMSKRISITPEGLAIHAEDVSKRTQELLDGDVIGEGDLAPYYDTLADSMELARGRLEEVMRTA